VGNQKSSHARKREKNRKEQKREKKEIKDVAPHLGSVRTGNTLKGGGGIWGKRIRLKGRKGRRAGTASRLGKANNH